jgi:hypothetical protein
MAKRQVFHSSNTKEGWVVTFEGKVVGGLKDQRKPKPRQCGLARKLRPMAVSAKRSCTRRTARSRKSELTAKTRGSIRDDAALAQGPQAGRAGSQKIS